MLPFRDPIVTSSTRSPLGPPSLQDRATHTWVPAAAAHQVSPTGSMVPGRSWAMVGSCSRTFYDSGARLPRARGEPQRTMGPESQYRKDILGAVCPHRDAGAELGDVLSGWSGGGQDEPLTGRKVRRRAGPGSGHIPEPKYWTISSISCSQAWRQKLRFS